MRLFLTRIMTAPSGIRVKVILSPAFIPKLSRMSFGIVVCPLLVRVASVLMACSGFLTLVIIVRNYRMVQACVEIRGSKAVGRAGLPYHRIRFWADAVWQIGIESAGGRG